MTAPHYQHSGKTNKGEPIFNNNMDSEVAPESVKFECASTRILQAIWEADLEKGPFCVYKLDLTDAYYQVLVPDDTVHKGISKCHKMDEKGTHFAVHVSPSIFGFKKIIPLHLSPFQKVSELYIFHMLIIA